MSEVLLRIFVDKINSRYRRVQFYSGTDEEFKLGKEYMCGMLVMTSEAWARLRDCLRKDVNVSVVEL